MKNIIANNLFLVKAFRRLTNFVRILSGWGENFRKWPPGILCLMAHKRIGGLFVEKVG